MTACLGKSCSFGSRCRYFVNVCLFFFFFFFFFVCAFPFGFEGGMCDLIVLVPDHCIILPFIKNMLLVQYLIFLPLLFIDNYLSANLV